jgi:predicted helicase
MKPTQNNIDFYISEINHKNKNTTKQLAKIIAIKTKFMAKVIENILSDEMNNCNDNSLLQKIYYSSYELCQFENVKKSPINETFNTNNIKKFREILNRDMPIEIFADICSQTIAYGMFAAKLNNTTNTPFTRSKLANLVSQSNTFLQKLFHYISGCDLDDRISLVVGDLVDLFNCIDLDKLLKEFSQTTHDRDPIIYFYEMFLAEYDPKLRKKRGVWYTPQPIAQFIVRAVDDILKQEFKLPLGLADNSKINVKLKQKNCPKNNNSTPIETNVEYHKVQILDPATGTGTFLAEIINNIHQQFQHKQKTWNNYVNKHLIPRLNGFEILIASCVVAQLKLDMLLQKTGCRINNEHLHIYLTNCLEESQPIIKLPFAQLLDDKLQVENRIKNQTPIMVVLGNPPYNVSSLNKNQWIKNLIQNYKTNLNEKNIQPLSDDYIKFIRYGQHFIEKNGQGIMAYVSNNSFIDGLIYRQMRKSLLESFDKIYIFDLHGNTRKKETTPNNDNDKNVFNIQQGISINIFVKTNDKKENKIADVFYFEMYGKRDEKYQFLSQQKLKTIKWQKLKFEDNNYFFVPKNFSTLQEYEKGFKITEIFHKHTSGIKTHHDKKYVGFDAFKNNNQFYNYRPFDIRYIQYDLEKIERHRYEIMKHVLKPDNISLCTCRQQSTFPFQHIFVTKYLSDICSVSLQTKETTFIFPLYIYPDDEILYCSRYKLRQPKNAKTCSPTNTQIEITELHDATNSKNIKRHPNLNEKIVNEIAIRLGLRYTQEKMKSKKTFAPIDLLDYIYAVLHSPVYRECYKEFLKIDFPRIPYPRDIKTFWVLAKLGFKLRQLHLLENVKPLPQIATYPKEGNNIIEQLIFENNKIWINQTQYFNNIPIEIWQFYIGGYQPAQKWLKDRRNRKLNSQDIQHYQKIIAALHQTCKIQKQIVTVHGFCAERVF